MAPTAGRDPLVAGLVAAADGFEWICSLAALFECGLLGALDRERPTTAAALADRLGLVPSLTAAALDLLEARQVVARGADGVVLSEAGARLVSSELARALAVLVPRAYGATFMRAGDLLTGRARAGDDVVRDPLARATGRSLFQRAAGQNHRIIAALEERNVRRVVDLACGVGALLLDLAARPGLGGVGIDLCQEAIERARATAAGSQVRFVHGDPLDPSVAAREADGAEAFTLLGASHECERVSDDTLCEFFSQLCRRAPGRWFLLGDRVDVSAGERWRGALGAQGPARLEADWRALFARTSLLIERYDAPASGEPPFGLWVLRT